MSRPPRVVDLSAQTFGWWTVVAFSHRRGAKYYWMAKCECGQERAVDATSLKAGTSTSCGCNPGKRGGVVKHGHAPSTGESPEYVVWAGIKARCTVPTSTSYPNYGGRGISLCDRWSAFENFLEDMGPRPSQSHSIERNDNDGNYEPGNCRWATRIEQANNQRSNRVLEISGRSQTVAQWSRESGVAPQLIYHRLKSGWEVERAVMTRPNPNKTGRPACAKT
jgi:hypothetical protein